MSEFAPVLLDVEDLTVEHGHPGAATRVLDRVSFHVRAGERLALVGESGSGKTTTARALLGLLSPHGRIVAGRIRMNGDDITDLTEAQWSVRRGRELALIPQDPMLSLDPTQRVGTQVAEGLRRHRVVARDAVEATVLRVLGEAGFDDPERIRHRYPHELSGGMRQRVLIAMAWASRPLLVVADEPTSALDVTVQRAILGNIDARIRSTGASIILITHDLGVALDRSDRIAVMRDGQIVETGPTQQVLSDPQHPYTRRLLSDNPHTGARLDRGPRGTGEQLLIATDLAKTFGSGADAHTAVDRVGFSLGRGRTLGIVGESGSGKSTTARILVGLEEPDAGALEICGRPARYDGWRRARATLRSVQMVFQDTRGSLDPRRPVWTAVAEPLRVHGLAPRRERKARALELLEMVHLDRAIGSRHPGQLSGGQRQRVAIARALAVQPQVLVCDEAVSALDVTVQAQILALFEEIQRDTGVAIVFISHDLGVVARIADDVLVMRRGSVVEAGSVEDIFTRPAHPYTRELLSAIPGQSAGTPSATH
ncbi:dipeptide ABC transporter ATP-binding protein [Microbacterium sp. E-13]|uniref:dipeptide ABC transporter ATP-binding protein n=1 Tax=Microbacterium sp. E-13 TaxID=3404048 RepID=UPI003CECC609